MIVGYDTPHCRFSTDAMTKFSLVASFELYFLLAGFSVSVSVYGLGGSTGFDLLEGSTGSIPS